METVLTTPRNRTKRSTYAIEVRFCPALWLAFFALAVCPAGKNVDLAEAKKALWGNRLSCGAVFWYTLHIDGRVEIKHCNLVHTNGCCPSVAQVAVAAAQQRKQIPAVILKAISKKLVGGCSTQQLRSFITGMKLSKLIPTAAASLWAVRRRIERVMVRARCAAVCRVLSDSLYTTSPPSHILCNMRLTRAGCSNGMALTQTWATWPSTRTTCRTCTLTRTSWQICSRALFRGTRPARPPSCVASRCCVLRCRVRTSCSM